MITYIKGDATEPTGNGLKVIPHVTNNKGAWGSGFVLSLSKKWGGPEYYYKQAAAEGKLKLGLTQMIQVADDIYVANMCAQTFYNKLSSGIPLKYWALQRCMQTVATFCHVKNASIHCPQFGAGLAGGDWNRIEKMINQEWALPVFVYLYEPEVKGKEYVSIR